MSHYTTLVIGEDPEALLAPYDEDLEVDPYRQYEDGTPSGHWAFDVLTRDGLAVDAGWRDFVQAWNARYGDESMEYDAERDQAYIVSTYNPKSKWDWYTLGGRWTGYYMLRDPSGWLGRDHGRVGRPGLMTAPARPGTADQARKADIDFDGMRALAEAEAISEHAKVMEILRGLPAPLRWDLVRDAHASIDDARKFYHAQPGIKALRDADVWVNDPVEEFCLDEDDPAAAYVARQVAQAGVPFAILTADGWAEKGHMGWFAIVTDEDADWTTTARRIIDAAPDSALFSIYDLHI